MPTAASSATPASPRARTNTKCRGVSIADVSSRSMTASQASVRCRWPDHRADLEGAGHEERLRFRRLGLEYRLPRDHHVITFGQEATNGESGVTAPTVKFRIIIGTLALLCAAVFSCPVVAQQP